MDDVSKSQGANDTNDPADKRAGNEKAEEDHASASQSAYESYESFQKDSTHTGEFNYNSESKWIKLVVKTQKFIFKIAFAVLFLYLFLFACIEGCSNIYGSALKKWAKK